MIGGTTRQVVEQITLLYGLGIVAVFLAYNANNGLPFVSTYDLKARVPNADALVKGNDIRIGGVLVGTVKSVVPVQLESGKVEAELSLSLDKNVEFQRLAGHGQFPFVPVMQPLLRSARRLVGLQPLIRRSAQSQRALCFRERTRGRVEINIGQRDFPAFPPGAFREVVGVTDQVGEVKIIGFYMLYIKIVLMFQLNYLGKGFKGTSRTYQFIYLMIFCRLKQGLQRLIKILM